MNKPRNWCRQPRFGQAAILLGIAGFVLLTLCARWNPIEAQQGVQKKKKVDPIAPAKETAASKKLTQPRTDPSLTAGKKVDSLALARFIDLEIQRRLAEDKTKASPLADDAEFLRRVYLDLVGVIPPIDKVTAFLASKDADKRAKVIDELLADPRFGNSLGERWANLMVPRDSNNRLLSTDPLKRWLAEGFNSGRPLNKIVYDLVTAKGTQEDNGAVTYFVGNSTPDKITDNVTRMFLGVQLQCAQCHNHPFTDYKQTEYWAMAAFFMKTRVSANPQQAAKKGVPVEVSESPKGPPGKKGLPEAAKIVPAKFLRGEQPRMIASEPARPVLAHWMTDDANPYFARAMANRFWYQLFGRGVVNPVDDMHGDNPPVHPAILGTLAEQLRLNQYDVKYLVRAICNTAAYQRTSRGGKDDEPANPDLYAQRTVRVLSPEQLFDSLTQILGQPARPQPKDMGKGMAKKGFLPNPRQQFINFFHVEDANPLEYQVGIPQALRLMNSVQMNRTEAPIAAAMKADKTPAAVFDRLYLVTLARPARAEEVQRLTAYVDNHGNIPRTYSDILWAILNSSEFVTNH
jgi:Protein of unknown function (DUF1549)/Protein of unknown function (DUF1553)